jgi:hypothetical protein
LTLRIVAFLLGLAAVVLAFVLPLQFGSGPVDAVTIVIGKLTGLKSLAAYAWYVPIGIAGFGTLITLLAPSTGSLIILISALAWFGLASLKPELFVIHLLAPTGTALVAAIMAFVAGEMGSRGERDYMRARRAPSSREAFAGRSALRDDPMVTRLDEPLLDEADPEGDDLGDEPVSAADAEAAVSRLAARRNRPTRAAAAAPSPAARRQRADGPEPRRSRGFNWISLVNGVVLVALLAGGGYYFYTTQMVAPNKESAAATQASKATAAATSDATARTDAPAVVPAAAGPAGPFAEATAFCAAVDTLDRPDARYTGPAFTQVMAQRLKIPMTTSPDRVRWRCVAGQVLICASFAGPVCDQTPSIKEMQDFCVLHPDVPALFAPSGTWSCVAGKPQLPDGAKWPIDAHGFFPAAWLPLSRPVATTAPQPAQPAVPQPSAADLLAAPTSEATAAPAAAGTPAATEAPADPETTGSTETAPIDPNKVAPVPATRPATSGQPLNIGG